MQSIDKTNADMTIDIDLQPELRGELDPKKLARLFHIIQIISTSFTIPNINIDLQSISQNKSSNSIDMSLKSESSGHESPKFSKNMNIFRSKSPLFDKSDINDDN